MKRRNQSEDAIFWVKPIFKDVGLEYGERAFRPASDVRVNGLYSLRKNELSELICNRA